MDLRRVVAPAVFFAALGLAASDRLFAAAVDGGPVVHLRMPPVSGGPGEEVVVEFRADVPVPMDVFVIHFDLPEKAAEYIRAEVAGTASSSVGQAAVWFDPKAFEGGYRIGVRYDTRSPQTPLPPGDDLLLVKGVFRLRADAPAGDRKSVV